MDLYGFAMPFVSDHAVKAKGSFPKPTKLSSLVKAE